MDGDAVSALYSIDLSNNYLVWQCVMVFKAAKTAPSFGMEPEFYGGFLLKED